MQGSPLMERNKLSLPQVYRYSLKPTYGTYYAYTIYDLEVTVTAPNQHPSWHYVTRLPQ